MPFIRHQEKNILFIHIPKTGGTSIETWMSDIAPLKFHSVRIPSHLKSTPQHLPFREIRSLFGDSYFDHIFTIVRNPYDRFISEYKFQSKKGRNQRLTQFTPTFSEWAIRQLEAFRKNPFHGGNHFRPQSSFLDFGIKIYKFEEGIETIISDAATKFNLPHPKTIPHKLKSDPIPAPELSLDVLTEINQVYKQDFEMLGYNFRQAKLEKDQLISTKDD